MDLILKFDRKAFQKIKHDLCSLSRSNLLKSIELVDFCSVVLGQALGKSAKVSDAEKEQLLYSICQVFYSVDVDSRCMISWVDFTAYCLKLIRNRFKTTARTATSTYSQAPPLHWLPVHKIFFCQRTQLLYAFDSEVPLIRTFRSGKMYDGNKFNPMVGVKKFLNIYCSKGTAYQML